MRKANVFKSLVSIIILACSLVTANAQAGAEAEKTGGARDLKAMTPAAARGLAYPVQTVDIEANLIGCQDDAFEPDDTCATSRSLALEGSEAHRHCDQDWVKFQAAAGGTYRVETLNLSGGADTTLELYGPTCANFIESNDDRESEDLSSLIEHTAAVSGTYRVRVGENKGDYQDGKGYDLRIQCVAGCSAARDSLVVGDFDNNGLDGLAGLSCDGRIFYMPNLSNWQQISGRLQHLVVGDYDGNGREDLAGLTSDGHILMTTDLSSWSQLPGSLSTLVSGDFNGDLEDDLAGLSPDGRIFYTDDMLTWNQIPGQLRQLVVGDFDEDTVDDLAGLTSDGRIYYTTDLFSWIQIPGALSRLITWDFSGLGSGDLAGLAADGRIFFSFDLSNWIQVEGRLSKLTHGDYDGNSLDDLAGLSPSGQIYYSLNILTWNQINGSLSRLAQPPNRNGELRSQLGGALAEDDLAGLAQDGRVFATLDKSTFFQLSGKLCPN